ncbi:hypothetical protein OF897_18355 [Chryseobacterium formosus]|uniref:Uncharacterized protein n=1 Tax=Chryseobacterium formosus TaxID=1537363 RepID=A0ABT3XW40_9FLAO|nr:hypothetical protein [Chryseobacterium formosus]MCX8525880.1 hypothetical protein [Chryseobacterium formosus]
MEDKLELFKASVPFATITGVIIGALLNSRLGRRDKIRDHLFSYKVKSYTILAESTSEIKRDVLNIRTDLRLNKPKSKYINDIWEAFIKTSNEQSLFLSNQTKHDLFILEGVIFDAFNKEIDELIDPESYSTDEMIFECDNILKACDIFVSKIQKELGIDKLNNKKIFSWNRKY